MKIVAYRGFRESTEPSSRRLSLPGTVRVLLTLIVGAVTLIAAFSFLLIVAAVLLGLAAVAVGVYSIRRFFNRTRMKLQQRSHRVTRVTVLQHSPSGLPGLKDEYWSSDEGPPRTGATG